MSNRLNGSCWFQISRLISSPTGTCKTLNTASVAPKTMQAALNRMLGQIQELLKRERRFIGVDRTTRLVNQLLTIARLEPDPSQAGRSPVELVSAVRDSLVQLTPWVLNKGLELSFDCSENMHEANVDFSALDIALHNLITNAVNFSPAGGQITVGLSFTAHHFELTVDDQGPGIDEQERERLFEPFYSRCSDQGVGLGLAIVQKVALLLDGGVNLQNRTGGGLRASLRAPLG